MIPLFFYSPRTSSSLLASTRRRSSLSKLSSFRKRSQFPTTSYRTSQPQTPSALFPPPPPARLSHPFPAPPLHSVCHFCLLLCPSPTTLHHARSLFALLSFSRRLLICLCSSISLSIMIYHTLFVGTSRWEGRGKRVNRDELDASLNRRARVFFSLKLACASQSRSSSRGR